jgi:hypothetical protein
MRSPYEERCGSREGHPGRHRENQGRDYEETTLNETPTPDWDAIEREVIRKLRYLSAAWEHTAANEPELHELMKRDLYLPTIKHLGAFCVAVKEE